MSGLYSTLFNGQGPHRSPTHFHPANRNAETVTNYEQHYIYNSRPAVQPSHEPAVFHHPAGWPGIDNNIPSSFIEEIQAKYQLLAKSKEIMEKQAAYISQLEKQHEEQNISGKGKELGQAKKEIKRLEKEKSEFMTRIENLDKYVGDLPTSEDYKKLRKELKYWKHHCSKLQMQMTKPEEKLTLGRKDLEEKALNADRFERENVDLRRMVKNLRDRIINYDEMHLKVLELEHVTVENEKLQADLVEMEKSLQEKQRKEKNFYLHSQESQKKLGERLSLGEDTVAALRERVSTKELNVSEIETSMKQLRRNVNILKDIVRFYYQGKEGRDLESLLLGTGASAETSRTVSQEQSLGDEVNELTRDIDDFRSSLLDHYVDELANNCITQ